MEQHTKPATGDLVDSEKQTTMYVPSRPSSPHSALDGQVCVRVGPYGIPLQPSPTEDANDPLNWSSLQKGVILVIVCYAAMMAIYLTGAPIGSFYLLEEQFNATYAQVNWTVTIPSLGLTIGPLLFNTLAESYGRRVLFIGCSALTILATGCTTIRSISYGGYMFCRFLQGVGAGPMPAVGFSIIDDIAWEHQRAIFAGTWVMSLDVGAVLGSLVGDFTAATGPFWANYHVAIAYGVLLLLSIFVLPETLYPRKQVLAMTERGDDLATLARRKDIKPWNIIKIPGVSHPRPYQGAVRFVKLWAYPRLVLPLFPYVFFLYWWVISLLTMQPAAYATDSTQIQGLKYLGLIIGTVLAELLIMVSRIANLRNKRMQSHAPEMRLYLGYPGAVLSAAGCILWGISVDREWHWAIGQVAFVLFSAGMQLGNSAVSTYIFDCYPEHTIEIMTFYTVLFNVSAFINPWFIEGWVDAVGYTWCFITQGLITLLLIPTFALLQIYGPRLSKEMRFD